MSPKDVTRIELRIEGVLGLANSDVAAAPESLDDAGRQVAAVEVDPLAGVDLDVAAERLGCLGRDRALPGLEVFAGLDADVGRVSGRFA